MRSHKSLLISQKCGQWLLCGLLHNGQCFTAGSAQTVTIRTSRLFLTLKCVHAHLCYMNNANVKCYELSLFNAHAKIWIFHIFMNVNKLCLINQQRKEGFLFYFYFFIYCTPVRARTRCGIVEQWEILLCPFHSIQTGRVPSHTTFSMQSCTRCFKTRRLFSDAGCLRGGGRPAAIDREC